MAACARLEMISACTAQRSRASGLRLQEEVGAVAVVLGGGRPPPGYLRPARRWPPHLGRRVALGRRLHPVVARGPARAGRRTRFLPVLQSTSSRRLLGTGGQRSLSTHDRSVRRRPGLWLALGHSVGRVLQRAPRLLLRRRPRLSFMLGRSALFGALTSWAMAGRARLRFRRQLRPSRTRLVRRHRHCLPPLPLVAPPRPPGPSASGQGGVRRACPGRVPAHGPDPVALPP
jgi:hypothetical protein